MNMFLLRIFCFLVCGNLIAINSISQEKEIFLKRFSTADGLPDNSIRSLFFDSKGFLWVGTEEGLARFDGEEFITYSRSLEDIKLPGNLITDIAEDSEGWLWLASQDGGICRFNPATLETFHPILPAFGGSEQNCAYAIRINSQGEIIVGTDKGIYVSSDGVKFEIFSEDILSSCYDLIIVNDKIYTAETKHGCREFSSNLKVKPVIDRKNTASVSFLNTLIIDGNNDFWFGAWNNYLHKYNTEKKQLKSYDFMSAGTLSGMQDEVRCLTTPSAGLIWVGTKSGQLWRFDTQTEKAEPLQITKRESGKLFGNKLLCMLTDNNGRTWIGTNNGLHLFDGATSRFDVTYLDEHEAVTCFTRAGEKMYIGALGAIYELEKGRCKKIIDGPQIYSSLYDSAVGVLLGTSNSMRKLDIERNQLIYPLQPENGKAFTINELGSSRFSFLYKYGEKYFANAYGYGVAYFDHQFQWDLLHTTTQDGADNLPNGMMTDSKNRLWMFGSLTGLMQANQPQFKSFSNGLNTLRWQNKAYNKGLHSKHITGMVELADGSLWVSTLGGGLYRFDPDNVDVPFKAIESPYQSIRGLVKDQNNKLWMVASGLLLSYDAKTNIWSKYEERDGIPKDGLYGNIYIDTDGQIYVGGNGFFIQFHPKSIMRSNEKPNTSITHFKVMDTQSDALLLQQEIKLPHYNNFITIDFASLCFSNASSATFKYMMKGIDDEWHDNGMLNSVSFSALSPGKYEFLVKATSAEGIEDSEAASLIIHLDSPFYAKWWFILLLLLFLSAVTYLILRARVRQRLQLELVRNKIARDLHDDIGSALGSISFFSETAKRTLENNNLTNTSLVLEKIGSTSREMIENMHDIVWAVNPINDAFEQVTLRMKNYGTDMAAANDFKLVFKEDEALHTIKLSMTERKNLFLIFKEALYNSGKYSQSSQIFVSLNQDSNCRVQMSIIDNGIGFDIPSKMGKGNGLKNMKNRAEEMGARFSITSSESTGTRIIVSL